MRAVRRSRGGGCGAGVHDRRRGADSRSERGAVGSVAGAGGARESGAAAQSARRGVRVGGGGRGGPAPDALRGPGAEARRMIEINLLPGKKKKAAGGAGFKLALPDFQGLLASIKNPWLLVASAASVIVVGGGLLLFITQSTRLRVLERRLVDVQAEKRRVDVVIAQKRQSEKMRDSLMSE